MWRNTARCFHSVCAKIPYRRPPAIGGEIAFCQSVQGGAGTPSGDHASIAGERRCFIHSTVYWTYERDFRAPMDSNQPDVGSEHGPSCTSPVWSACSDCGSWVMEKCSGYVDVLVQLSMSAAPSLTNRGPCWTEAAFVTPGGRKHMNCPVLGS